MFPFPPSSFGVVRSALARLASSAIGLGTVVGLAACEAYDLGDKRAPIIEVDAKNPTWGSDIQPILAYRCDNCHTKGPTPFAPASVAPYKVGFSTLTEAEFKKSWAALSLTYIQSATKPMPPNYADPLLPDERAALVKYLTAAKAASAATTLAGCTQTTTTLTFERDIKPITSAECASCHVGAAPAGNGVALDTAARFKTYRVAAVEYLTGKRNEAMPLGDSDYSFAKSADGKKVIEWLCASGEVK